MAEIVQNSLVADLHKKLSPALDHLFVSVSYEERALTLWNTLHGNISGEKFLCYNANHSFYLDQHLRNAKQAQPDAAVVPLDSDNPVASFDTLQRSVRRLATRPCRVGVDSTGFTREGLALLVFLLMRSLPRGSTVVFFYHKAVSYGRSQSGGWLSQGVSSVRTVLGYSGNVRLSANTHLVLLPGYEFERAQSIIDVVQPSRLTLGVVKPENSVSSDLHATLLRFISRLRAFYSHWNIEEFEFSSVNAFFTRDQISEYLEKQNAEENVVIASLNSKPATIGTCLAVLRTPAWQLLYAQPRLYNVEGYSKPSNEVSFFEIAVET